MARNGNPTEEGKRRMRFLITMPTRTRGLAGWQLKLQWRRRSRYDHASRSLKKLSACGMRRTVSLRSAGLL
jgi:hypothetical protein